MSNETKKIAPEWKIAVYHTSRSLLLIPVAVWIVGNGIYLLSRKLLPVLTAVLVSDSIILSISEELIVILIMAGAVWLGTYYSSKSVNRTFCITNRKNIINLSILFCLFLAGLSIFSPLYDLFEQFSAVISAVVSIAVFNFASNRYLEDDERGTSVNEDLRREFSEGDLVHNDEAINRERRYFIATSVVAMIYVLLSPFFWGLAVLLAHITDSGVVFFGVLIIEAIFAVLIGLSFLKSFVFFKRVKREKLYKLSKSALALYISFLVVAIATIIFINIVLLIWSV